MDFKLLRLDQSRQTADLGQAFATLKEGRDQIARYRGTMRWKSIKGNTYLYRRVGAKDASLGPRSERTEHIKQRFETGKADAEAIHAAARTRIEEMAPVNRAMGLGRVPLIAARIARRLDQEGLLGSSVFIVGANSLYCYEAMAGGHFATELTSTEDIDLLLDSRASLQIVSEEMSSTGLVGILRSVDRSFRKLSNNFRMVNRDNFLVDLIAPMPRNVLRSKQQSASRAPGDLVAAEIQGLQWLINAPKVSAMAIDARGLPVPMSCVDPRYYAVHKLWLSELEDRDPSKRHRDRAQAKAVAKLVSEYLPSLTFEGRALESLPKPLRERVGELVSEQARGGPEW